MRLRIKDFEDCFESDHPFEYLGDGDVMILRLADAAEVEGQTRVTFNRADHRLEIYPSRLSKAMSGGQTRLTAWRYYRIITDVKAEALPEGTAFVIEPFPYASRVTGMIVPFEFARAVSTIEFSALPLTDFLLDVGVPVAIMSLYDIKPPVEVSPAGVPLVGAGQKARRRRVSTPAIEEDVTVNKEEKDE